MLSEQIGVSRLYFVNPGLAPQSVIFPDQAAQVTRWEVSSALLDVEGTSTETSPDLAPGGDCQFVAVASEFTEAAGACEIGLVLDASNEPLLLKLTLEIGAMELRRAKPVILALGPSDDFDGDGARNDGALWHFSGCGQPVRYFLWVH